MHGPLHPSGTHAPRAGCVHAAGGDHGPAQTRGGRRGMGPQPHATGYLLRLFQECGGSLSVADVSQGTRRECAGVHPPFERAV